jgi:hypothetical protein
VRSGEGMATSMDQRLRGRGVLVVCFEGGKEEGKKRGATASGGALFEWRSREQR